MSIWTTEYTRKLKMRYAQIRKCDVANGKGIRTSLFVQGCTFQCKGCFNTDTWDFEGGRLWDESIEKQFVELTGKPHIAGATILGGEPLHPANCECVTRLAKRLKSEYPEKTIWVYSGYCFEELAERESEIFEYIDVLVDGRFEQDKKDLSLRFRGSSNQRVIDIKKTLEEGRITLYME